MDRVSFGSRVTGLVCAGAMAASMCMPVMAFADNGVQGGSQSYGDAAGTPSEYTWSGGEGAIDLTYSTEGGQWQEPGGDATDESDNIAHDNGTYVLTIPKLISYTGMAIGNVSTSDDYTVNLRGALEAGKVVNVSAEASGSLANADQAATDSSNITFTTTRGKESWNAAEAYGTLNADGSLSGTNATDNIAMSGIVKTAGEWTGHVQYLCDTSAAPQSWDAGAVPGSVTATLDHGLLTVSGQGAMGDFSVNSMPWADSRSSIRSAVIEDGVTRVGSNDFNACTNLTSVALSDSVESIGDSAFEQCTSLPSVTIPESVISIGTDAFANCSNLTSIDAGFTKGAVAGAPWGADSATVNYAPVNYGNVVNSWDVGAVENTVTATLYDNGTLVMSGQGAMKDFATASEVPWYRSSHPQVISGVIEDGVTRVGAFAFAECMNMTSVIIPDSVTSIGKCAFMQDYALSNVTIPDSVTSIESQAFSYCRTLTSVAIPDGVTSISGSMFENCGSLTSVNIPDSVTSIGMSAFSSCSNLTSITIPGSVTSIGYSAFGNCDKLANVTISNGVTSIGKLAFEWCTSLTSITIPGSVTSIALNSFSDCSNLNTINAAFAEGAVANAPWGADNATINYNYAG